LWQSFKCMVSDSSDINPTLVLGAITIYEWWMYFSKSLLMYYFDFLNLIELNYSSNLLPSRGSFMLIPTSFGDFCFSSFGLGDSTIDFFLIASDSLLLIWFTKFLSDFVSSDSIKLSSYCWICSMSNSFSSEQSSSGWLIELSWLILSLELLELSSSWLSSIGSRILDFFCFFFFWSLPNDLVLIDFANALESLAFLSFSVIFSFPLSFSVSSEELVSS